MTRQEVYSAIDTEREYQRVLTNDPARPDVRWDMHVGDHLTAIQYNLNKAIEAWYKDSNNYEATMEFVRKIAGLCVQAGEMYGMPDRKQDVSYSVMFNESFSPPHPDKLLKIIPSKEQ